MDDIPPRGYDPHDEAVRTQVARAEVATHPIEARGIALVTLAVLAVFYTLKVAAALILPFLVAIVLNLVLRPARNFLHNRLRIPAPLVALLLIGVLFGLLGAIGAAISVPASGWIARAPEGIKMIEERLHALQGPLHYLQSGIGQLEGMISGGGSGAGAGGGGGGSTGGLMSSLSGFGLSVLQGTGAAMGTVLTLIVLLLFLLTSGDTLLRRLVEVMPSFADKRRLVEITNQIERNVAGYLATITMMNVLVGIGVGLVAWLCGLPDGLLWGTLAFVLNYVPIIGAVVGIFCLYIVGLFTYGSLVTALLPAGLYLLIHVIEGEAVTPMLLANRFTLNPVLVIASLFFWDYMWGVVGALLAVPVLAIAKIVCDRVGPLMPLGHVMGGPPPRGRLLPAKRKPARPRSA